MNYPNYNAMDRADAIVTALQAAGFTHCCAFFGATCKGNAADVEAALRGFEYSGIEQDGEYVIVRTEE